MILHFCQWTSTRSSGDTWAGPWVRRSCLQPGLSTSMTTAPPPTWTSDTQESLKDWCRRFVRCSRGTVERSSCLPGTTLCSRAVSADALPSGGLFPRRTKTGRTNSSTGKTRSRSTGIGQGVGTARRTRTRTATSARPWTPPSPSSRTQ